MIGRYVNFHPHSAITVSGTSAISFSEAARDAVAHAEAELGRTAPLIMDSFDVVSQGGTIVEGAIAEFQVTLTVWYKVRY